MCDTVVMETCSVEMYRVYFVLQPGKTKETVGHAMRNAFESMEDDFQTSWMTSEEALTYNGKEQDLFVCDPFKGKAFEYLMKSGKKIFGPLCIESCLEKGEQLPSRNHPVYSTCMRRFVVSCTGMEANQRMDIAKKVSFMCGVYSKDLTQQVTHVVVGEGSGVGSKKYRAAVDNKLPLVTAEWVYECWNVLQHKKRHAREDFHQKFSCPPFKGLVISLSQVCGEERKMLQKLIEKNGGKFSGPVRAQETTHLVLCCPEGDKYKFAVSWKLWCVTPDWLRKSVQAGHCLSEENFLVNENGPRIHGSSTPKKGQGAMLLNDCSTITNVSIRSRVDETVMSDASYLQLPAKVNGPPANPLDAFDVKSIPKSCECFDGCLIFLYGFTGLQLEKVQKIVNAGQGNWYSKLTDKVTHVVVKSAADLDRFPAIRDVQVPVVTYDWLLSCCESLELVDDTPYLCLQNISFSPAKTLPLSKLGPEITSGEFSTAKSSPSCGMSSAALVVIDDLMKQYMPTDNSRVEERKDSATLDDGDATNIPIEDVDESLVFSGLKFAFDGFKVDDLKFLTGLAEENGGIVHDEQEADFVIVPLLGCTGVPSAKNVATNCWLQRSIEEDKLLDLNENALFKHILVKPDCTLLRNCVICFSQYTGTERDSMIHLAQALGAKCQDYLVRFANHCKGLLPTTHLIVGDPEGSKYEGALKWKIPAVTKHWLLETALRETRAKEDDFLVKPKEAKNVEEKTIVSENRTTEDESDFSRPVLVKQEEDLANKVTLDSTNTSERKVHEVDEPSTSRPKESLDSKPARKSVLPNSRVLELIEGDTNCSLSSAASSPGMPDPDGPFRPRYDLEGVMESFDSPASGSRRKSSSIDELFSYHLSLACKNRGITTTCRDPHPLKGVVLCVAKKLASVQSELNRICGDSGGDYRWSYDKYCTHFVFQGKTGDSSKELRLAKEEGKKIVSPDWLHACQSEQKRVDESMYPFTYNPRLSILSQVGNVSSSQCSVSVGGKKVADSETTSKEGNASEKHSNDESSASSSALFGDVSRQLQELMTATTSAKVERCKTRRANGSSGSPSSADSAPKVKVRTHLQAAEVEPQPSQSIPITWDDPMGRMEQEKIAAHLSHCPETQSTQGDEDFHIERKFLFSGLTDDRKRKFSAIVERLGGTIQERGYDPSVTHLVIKTLMKNEKFLSCVAACKWVLHESYLEECERKGDFVPEEAHEWRGPVSGRPSKAPDMSPCPRRWRLRFDETRKLAFHDWKVIVVCEPGPKMQTFKGILQAGGATILPSDASMDATLALVDIAKNGRSVEADLEHFEAVGIRCAKAEYLAMYLLEEDPQIERFLLHSKSNASILSRKRKTDRDAISQKKSRSK